MAEPRVGPEPPGGPEPPAPLLRDELSLYGAPRPEPPRVEPAAGDLEQRVAAVRRLTEPYAGWCRATYDVIEPKVQSAVGCARDTCGYLRDPPKDFYPRAGVICFTGVLGLLLARRSRAKRLVYPAGLVSATAAMYYPERAAAADCGYDRAVRSSAALEKMAKPQRKGSDSGE